MKKPLPGRVGAYRNKGFTLTEVMITVALIGLLGLALTSTFLLLTRIRQNATAITDAQELNSLVTMQVANPQICKELMGAKNSGTNPAGNVISAAALAAAGTPTGIMPYSIYQVPAPSPTILIGATPAGSPTNNIYGLISVDSLKLEILRAGVGTSTTQVLSALHFSISKLANGGKLGRQNYDIYIPVGLLLESSTNTLLSCASAAADLGTPQCSPGQHLVLSVQSGSPSPTQWKCQ
jgi:prepilin-type N-terminal cleavage/methylation domain-containing protein